MPHDYRAAHTISGALIRNAAEYRCEQLATPRHRRQPPATRTLIIRSQDNDQQCVQVSSRHAAVMQRSDQAVITLLHPNLNPLPSLNWTASLRSCTAVKWIVPTPHTIHSQVVEVVQY
jgi:hypothetical protein